MYVFCHLKRLITYYLEEPGLLVCQCIRVAASDAQLSPVDKALQGTPIRRYLRFGGGQRKFHWGTKCLKPAEDMPLNAAWWPCV